MLASLVILNCNQHWLTACYLLLKQERGAGKMGEIKVRGWKNGRRRRNTISFTTNPTLQPESNAKINWSLNLSSSGT